MRPVSICPGRDVLTSLLRRYFVFFIVFIFVFNSSKCYCHCLKLYKYRNAFILFISQPNIQRGTVLHHIYCSSPPFTLHAWILFVADEINTFIARTGWLSNWNTIVCWSDQCHHRKRTVLHNNYCSSLQVLPSPQLTSLFVVLNFSFSVNRPKTEWGTVLRHGYYCSSLLPPHCRS